MCMTQKYQNVQNIIKKTWKWHERQSKDDILSCICNLFYSVKDDGYENVKDYNVQNSLMFDIGN